MELTPINKEVGCSIRTSVCNTSWGSLKNSVHDSIWHSESIIFLESTINLTIRPLYNLIKRSLKAKLPWF